VSNYTLTISGSYPGARGLAVDWSGANPVIFATAIDGSANRLVRIVDTGPSAATVTVRTAPSGTAFRGMAWTPVRLSEPTIISEHMLGGGSFQLIFTGTATQPYRMLASANVAAPLATWTMLASGMFGADPVTFTNLTAVNQPLRFYRIVSP
jgi:hypothetical protein